VSTIAINRVPPEARSHPPLVTTMDNRRGTGGMWLFILTEAFLFLGFFFAYFYLAEGSYTWPNEPLPSLYLAVPMLVLVLIGSGILVWGEKQLAAGKSSIARLALGAAILTGLGFLVMEGFEFRNDLQVFTPQTGVYGSIFYTILGFHVAHLCLGILMLAYALILPKLEPVDRPPHRPYHNVALYWHFVVFIWFVTVMFLYVTPYMR
jgi:cytochrome c oxidase subunit 3